MIFNDTSKKIHIAGIGGVSMSALAEALNYKGFVVTGSDMNDGEHIERLRCIGIKQTDTDKLSFTDSLFVFIKLLTC